VLAKVRLSGCDDSTRLELEVTEEEFLFLKRLEDESGRHGGGCQPTLLARRAEEIRVDEDGWEEGWYSYG
jgi:hypothetical protein